MKHDSFVKRLLHSKVYLWILVAIALLIVIGYTRAYYKNYLVNKQIEQIQSEIGKMEQKKIESLDILKYVMSDEFVEEKARVELNMKKPGESVAFVSPDAAQIQTSAADYSQDGLTTPRKWFNYFFRR